MRFSRDKRGYESTFVMHAFREHGRGQPRILYWFRTPPNVRVGRAALDEEAIRSIEESHPGLEFDWTRILKPAPPVEPPPRPDPRGRPRRNAARPGRSGRPARAARAAASPAVIAAAPAAPAVPEAPAAPRVLEEPIAEWTAEELERGVESVETMELPPARHVEERLGREGLDRLRARYAELLARIAERVSDPVRLEELRGQAERLNPDTWVTDEEVRQGIEQFDAASDALRARLGRRKRRRRGGARRRKARLARLEGAQPGGQPSGPDGASGGDPPDNGDPTV